LVDIGCMRAVSVNRFRPQHNGEPRRHWFLPVAKRERGDVDVWPKDAVEDEDR
jgi:hypothetical protein